MAEYKCAALSAPSLVAFCCLPPFRLTLSPSIATNAGKMFTSSRTNKSHRDSFSYRASKQTSKKKDRSFREKDLSQSRRVVAHSQASPTKSQASSAPTSP